jgi:hypothetical protein
MRLKASKTKLNLVNERNLCKNKYNFAEMKKIQQSPSNDIPKLLQQSFQPFDQSHFILFIGCSKNSEHFLLDYSLEFRMLKHILALLLVITLINFTSANVVKDFVKDNIASPVYDGVTEVTGDALNEIAKGIEDAKNAILNGAIPEDKQDLGYAFVFQNAWMGKNFEALKQMKLKELLLPASHDTGCYDLSFFFLSVNILVLKLQVTTF